MSRLEIGHASPSVQECGVDEIICLSNDQAYRDGQEAQELRPPDSACGFSDTIVARRPFWRTRRRSPLLQKGEWTCVRVVLRWKRDRSYSHAAFSAAAAAAIALIVASGSNPTQTFGGLSGPAAVETDPWHAIMSSQQALIQRIGSRGEKRARTRKNGRTETCKKDCAQRCPPHGDLPRVNGSATS